ncbi:MAG: YebC/PmpR family DNA-binding transcriptional regulator [Saprospiraceae bacterium]|nr:YebC/PmpR family DNA-binding transcriptional regulator [Saprospiraceae bacterium]
MGRAFEYRKARKFARWGAMAKIFTKIGKEIALAVKEGGPDPNYNSRLRAAVNNAKKANMPKANVESAIKKATSKEAENYSEVVYEGYGPHGIAIMVETTTDNTTRTVANIRMHFNKCNGTLGNFGSVEFMFTRKGVFRVKKDVLPDYEELELEMIDYGLDEIKDEGEVWAIYCTFTEFGAMQKFLEDKGIEIDELGLERIPTTTKKLTDEQVEDIFKLTDRLEDDDDVANVFTTLDMSE